MEKRPNRKYASYTPMLIEMYEKRKLSIEAISKITGIPDITIRRMLRDKGVEIAKPGVRPGTRKQ